MRRWKLSPCKISARLKRSSYMKNQGDELIFMKAAWSKSWKSWNLWFSGLAYSKITVSKPRSVAPTRNLQITCRGEASTSVSNTPPGHFPPRHTADFRRISTMFFKDCFKSATSFPESFEYPAEDSFKRGACKSSARLKHSGYHFSFLDEINLNNPRVPKSWKALVLSFPSRSSS